MEKQLPLTDEQKKLSKDLTRLQLKVCLNLHQNPKMSHRQAYLAAGGTAKSESSQDSAVSVMLSNAKVSAFMNSLNETKISSAIMEREEALEILSRNARVKMTDVADFAFIQVGEDPEGEPIMQTVWTMKNAEDIDPDIVSCIKSVTMTKQGPKIELHDQHGAIKQLSDLQGWNAPKKTEVTGKDGQPVGVMASVSPEDVAKALENLTDKL